jgi:hypothetical protein
LIFDIRRVVPRQSALAPLQFQRDLAIHKTPAPKCIESGGHRPARQTHPGHMTQHIRRQREAGSKIGNADDFLRSPVPAITPVDFLSRFPA